MIQRIELVSATRSTVLITGETGTGKELVARAVHQRSAQRALPFVKVNCAAIPEGLLESELFGHVRGAFTGATGNRKGKFALADRGSIFLDEIGTMSGTLQAKLLRVLQEREIEPVGGERPEPLDVRVIAATNRDLRQLVDEGRFQDDLFYRLHVVPIVVPALRERVEDIPMLAEYFAVKHAARCGKAIEALEDGVIASLQEVHWPGTCASSKTRSSARWCCPPARRSPGHGDGRHDEERTDTGGALAEAAPERGMDRVRDDSPGARDVTQKRDAASLMGISPRALSHYLAKYPFIDRNRTVRRESLHGE
jgi:hypothetical protein